MNPTDVPSAPKMGAIRRKSVRVSAEELVKTYPLLPDRRIPLVVEPAVEGLDLAAWGAEHKEQVGEWLTKHRALLFRNFPIKTADQFQACVSATSTGKMLEYVDRTTPRPAVGNGVYVSTVYPSEETINAHNEGTYWIAWPLKIYFCSLKTAEQGGETPIWDVRNVLQRIPEATREKFAQKKVMYVRNYNDGFGLPWQETFQTKDKSVVEAYCQKNRIEFEWKGGDRLRTRQVRPAIRVHPQTGEKVWFNHAAFFHQTTLDPKVRSALLQAFGEDNLPYNTYYGDGTPIEPEAVEEIRQAYAGEKIVFGWKDGDIMLLDNMTVAHGREPYKGKREVVVAMVEPVQDE